MNNASFKVKRILLSACFVDMLFCGISIVPVSAQTVNKNKVFPHTMPLVKPNIPLSEAMNRMFDYPAPRAQDNPFYTTFKYTPIEGFDYHNGNGCVSRRDPSRPIAVNGKYYMWYTKRDTKCPPIGASKAAQATDSIPSTDWDLCDIWYATSNDGFNWKEEGVAVKRPSKPNLGWRSVATPEILEWKGKYYLYFQAFNEPSGLKGDWCPISMAYSDSPSGPWKLTGKPIFEFGKKGDWDQDQAQDPNPIVYKGKIYLYYKSTYNKWPDKRDKYAVAHGLVIADDPLGKYKRHPLSPVMNSGHETAYFPFKGGVVALAIHDGNERETIQFAPDGVNFHIVSVVSLPPIAPGFYTPDAFTNTKDGKGVKWGICHFTNVGLPGKGYSILARFDCDLTQTTNEKEFKNTTIYLNPEVYFKMGLGNLKKQRIEDSTLR